MLWWWGKTKMNETVLTDILGLAEQIFMVYGLSLLICTSSIFYPLRNWIISKTTFLTIDGVHLLKCRLCVGFWITVVSCTIFQAFSLFWIIFGTSYLLATQER